MGRKESEGEQDEAPGNRDGRAEAVAQDGTKKEIVAFANNNGGTVYEGVDNDGNVLDVEDANGCALQISTWCETP